MKNIKWISIIAACGLGIVSLNPTWGQAQQDLEEQLKDLAPKKIRDFADKFSRSIRVRFSRSDMEGTGRHDFIVVAYMLNGGGGTMQVYKQTDAGLIFVAALEEEDGEFPIMGGGFEFDLIDLDNDGKPEIFTREYGIRDTNWAMVYKFTGSSLKLILGGPNNAEVADLDNDGIMEIIETPVNEFGGREDGDIPISLGNYVVYRFNGLEYEKAYESENPPAAMGVPIFATQGIAYPDHATLSQLLHRQAERNTKAGTWVVRLGNLHHPLKRPGATKVTAMDIDRNTLILDRTFRPVRTFIRPAEAARADLEGSEGAGGFNGPFLELHFNRSDILELLPRLKLNGPLEPCDRLTLEIKGKMLDGAPFRAFAPITITGKGGLNACDTPPGQSGHLGRR